MKRDALERFVSEAAKDYNLPPETPREEMWSAIRERLRAPEHGPERRHDPMDLGARRSRRSRSQRLRRWTPWAIGVATAATLAAGFGLGRLTLEQPLPAPVSPVASEGPSSTVRLAAAEHLGEAEALLTLYRSSASPTDHESMDGWARELLLTTRLMMDSRAGEDRRMAQLLGDLELVLVQIVNAGGEGAAGADEQALIAEGIEQRQLMAKLRSAGSGPLDMAL